MVLAATAFSFCRWWLWCSPAHRSNGVAWSGVGSSPLNRFLTICPYYTVAIVLSHQLSSAAL